MFARVDEVRPTVQKVFLRDGKVVVETSEEFLEEPLMAGSSGGLVSVGAGGASAEVPVQEGPMARRRVELSPDQLPAEGDTVSLSLAPDALWDLFLNQPLDDFTLSFTWDDAQGQTVVLFDQTPPKVERVGVRNGRLEIIFSEEVDLQALAAAAQVPGATVTWELLEDGYTACTNEALAPGTHELSLSTALTDLAGLSLESLFSATFEVKARAPWTEVYRAPDDRKLEFGLLGQRFGFHGRPLDKDTGLIYFRNRYYDPEMGRFLTPDPMGYVDGPSMYAFAGNGPVNNSDPLGLDSSRYTVWGEAIGSAASAEAARAQRAAEDALWLESLEVRPRLEYYNPYGTPEGRGQERLFLSNYFLRQRLGNVEIANRMEGYVGPAGSCGGLAEQFHCALASGAILETEFYARISGEISLSLFLGLGASEVFLSQTLAKGVSYTDELARTQSTVRGTRALVDAGLNETQVLKIIENSRTVAGIDLLEESLSPTVADRVFLGTYSSGAVRAPGMESFAIIPKPQALQAFNNLAKSVGGRTLFDMGWSPKSIFRVLNSSDEIVFILNQDLATTRAYTYFELRYILRHEPLLQKTTFVHGFYP